MIKDKVEEKKKRRIKIRKRIKQKIIGTAERPRLTVYKSTRYIYAQAVDDSVGRTVAFASTLEKSFLELGKNRKNLKAAEKLGELIGKRLLERGVNSITFDRNGYPYHGKVKALAEAVRKAGLKF